MRTVAIIGRPNVGKSTLFNRFTQKPTAIVDNQPGITRDRIYDEVEWGGRTFRLIDTGGLCVRPQDVFEKEIQRQVVIATEEADVILLVVDVLTDVTQQDSEIAQLLRRQTKPVLVVVNKVDNDRRMQDIHAFHGLGFEGIFPISAINGHGTGDLLDRVIDLLPAEADSLSVDAMEVPRIAIVGQPNVGKSTLTNALLNDERSLVTPIAGTTRDAIHTAYKLFGKDLVLIDTAGLRRKDRSKENVEFYSAIRTVKALDHADVCMIVFDVSQADVLTAQDVNIFVLAQNKGKGIVLLANKWDLVADKETNSSKQLEEYIRNKLAPFRDVPIVFISALEKQRIHKALELALDIYARRKGRISTSALNDWLSATTQKYPHPMSRGRSIKIKFMTQLPTPVPSFAFFCNHPKLVSKDYKHYLENQLRAHFPLTGIPIRLYFREK